MLMNTRVIVSIAGRDDLCFILGKDPDRTMSPPEKREAVMDVQLELLAGRKTIPDSCHRYTGDVPIKDADDWIGEVIEWKADRVMDEDDLAPDEISYLETLDRWIAENALGVVHDKTRYTRDLGACAPIMDKLRDEGVAITMKLRIEDGYWWTTLRKDNLQSASMAHKKLAISFCSSVQAWYHHLAQVEAA
jgi:hypothetical protein